MCQLGYHSQLKLQVLLSFMDRWNWCPLGCLKWTHSLSSELQILITNPFSILRMLFWAFGTKTLLDFAFGIVCNFICETTKIYTVGGSRVTDPLRGVSPVRAENAGQNVVWLWWAKLLIGSSWRSSNKRTALSGRRTKLMGSHQLEPTMPVPVYVRLRVSSSSISGKPGWTSIVLDWIGF